MVCIYLNLFIATSFYCHQVTQLKWKIYLVRSAIWPARSEHHNCLNFCTAKALFLGCVRLVTQLGRDAFNRDAMNYYPAHGRMVKPLKKVKIHPGSLVTCQKSENIERFHVNQLCHPSIFLAGGNWFVRPNVASEPRTAANAFIPRARLASLWVLVKSSFQGNIDSVVMALNVKPTLILFKPECVKETSLRKQPAFGDATTGFPAKWRLRNERRNSMVMTRHYQKLGVASDWSK